MYLADGEMCKDVGAVAAGVDFRLVEVAGRGGGGEAVVAGDDSGGRRVGSLSRADLDRWYAERRSAMDYAMGRLVGGGSDGRERCGWKKRSLMDRGAGLGAMSCWLYGSRITQRMNGRLIRRRWLACGDASVMG